MNIFIEKCKEVFLWLSKLQRVIVKTIIAWATLWPFVYIVIPMILGDQLASELLKP
jgi:hypothetical protein